MPFKFFPIFLSIKIMFRKYIHIKIFLNVYNSPNQKECFEHFALLSLSERFQRVHTAHFLTYMLNSEH